MDLPGKLPAPVWRTERILPFYWAKWTGISTSSDGTTRPPFLNRGPPSHNRLIVVPAISAYTPISAP